MTREEFNNLLDKIKADREVSKEVDTLGGISHKTVQSDKLGFDWKETFVGEKLVAQEYIEQDIKRGTEDNPIEYYDGVELINNAFYLKDGKLVVYMDGQFIEW